MEKKKGVSAIDFFCIGFGAIVGVGWAVSINSWMNSSGRSASGGGRISCGDGSYGADCSLLLRAVYNASGIRRRYGICVPCIR